MFRVPLHTTTLCVCMYECVYECMYECVNVCMYECMHVFTCVCSRVSVCKVQRGTSCVRAARSQGGPPLYGGGAQSACSIEVS